MEENRDDRTLACGRSTQYELEAKTEDSAVEKHVPFVEDVEDGVVVRVGENTAHPMGDDHHIKFIEVHSKDMVLKAELDPNGAPEAKFPVKKTDIVKVREWCNLHGLWEV